MIPSITILRLNLTLYWTSCPFKGLECNYLWKKRKRKPQIPFKPIFLFYSFSSSQLPSFSLSSLSSFFHSLFLLIWIDTLSTVSRLCVYTIVPPVSKLHPQHQWRSLSGLAWCFLLPSLSLVMGHGSDTIKFLACIVVRFHGFGECTMAISSYYFYMIFNI